MEYDDSVAVKMRDMRRAGFSIVDIMHYLVDAMSLNENSRLIVIAYMRRAFSLELRDAMMVGSWAFFTDGTWDSKMIEENVGRLC